MTPCGRVAGQRRFVYRGGPTGFVRGAPGVRKGTLDVSLPAYSMTVLDVHLARQP
jgi:hypothetical protein